MYVTHRLYKYTRMAQAAEVNVATDLDGMSMIDSAAASSSAATAVLR